MVIKESEKEEEKKGKMPTGFIFVWEKDCAAHDLAAPQAWLSRGSLELYTLTIIIIIIIIIILTK